MKVSMVMELRRDSAVFRSYDDAFRRLFKMPEDVRLHQFVVAALPLWNLWRKSL